jgi:hypothetical protein
MKRATAIITSALLFLNLASAKTNKTEETQDEETQLELKCIKGKWRITYAKNKKVIAETKANRLEGKPCKTK